MERLNVDKIIDLFSNLLFNVFRSRPTAHVSRQTCDGEAIALHGKWSVVCSGA